MMMMILLPAELCHDGANPGAVEQGRGRLIGRAINDDEDEDEGNDHDYNDDDDHDDDD
jgi:hypothetical protein